MVGTDGRSACVCLVLCRTDVSGRIPRIPHRQQLGRARERRLQTERVAPLAMYAVKSNLLCAFSILISLVKDLTPFKSMFTIKDHLKSNQSLPSFFEISFKYTYPKISSGCKAGLRNVFLTPSPLCPPPVRPFVLQICPHLDDL